MSKYIFVEPADESNDYAKLTFIENIKENLAELWQKIWDSENHQMSYNLHMEDNGDEWDEEYDLSADNLDDHTVEKMQGLIDYDTDKARGWVKAE